MSLFRPTAAALLLCLAVNAALADTVELVNGDTLTGTITEQNDQHVIIKHDVLGDITVPREKVVSIITPKQAEAIESAEEANKVENAKSILTGAGFTVAPPAEEEPPTPPIKIGPFSLFEGWDRQIEFGVVGSEGNTDEVDVRFAYLSGYEDDQDRWKLDAVYFGGRDNNETSDNEFYAQVLRDWLLPEKKHFYFAAGRYDFDQFKDWDSRVSGFGGIGYDFKRSDDFRLTGRAGLGGNYEWNGVNGDDFTPEALLGISVNWQIDDRQKLTFSNNFFPDLEGFDDFRNLTTFSWQIDIDKDRGLALKIGLENEYESDTDEAEENDFDYYLSLVWSF